MAASSEADNTERSFTNDPIELATAPVLADTNFEPIDPKYLQVSLVSLGIVAVITVIVGIVVRLLVTDHPAVLIGAAATVVLLAVLAVLRILDVRNIAYQIREHDLSYRRGVLVKVVSTVPFVRVQHARIRQGPVERRFGLATLDVNSAGPDIAITGLSLDTAETMKALVIERAGDLVEDE